MKTYTGRQYATQMGGSVMIWLLLMVILALRARYGETLPGREWIPVWGFVSVIIASGFVWERANGFQSLGSSFLIDQHDRVVLYVSGALFVNAKQLKQQKLRAIKHSLHDIVVDGIHPVRVAGVEKEITVQATVWVDADPLRLQDYFDAFLKSSGLPTAEDMVRELVEGCEFFRKQAPVVCRADSFGLAAVAVGKKLAERLKEELAPHGLRIKMVASAATE